MEQNYHLKNLVNNTCRWKLQVKLELKFLQKLIKQNLNVTKDIQNCTKINFRRVKRNKKHTKRIMKMMLMNPYKVINTKNTQWVKA